MTTDMRVPPLVAAAVALSISVVACASGGQPSASVALAPSAAPPSASAAGVPSTEVSPMPSTPASASPSLPTATTFNLASSAFDAGGAIPREFTCDGANGSPPLAWSGVPAGTASLVLLVDDPDAGDFAHWIVLDLRPADDGLAKGVDPGTATLQQGTNDFGKTGWGGPCPPSGTHHYRFTLSALSAPLGLAGHPKVDAVRSALAKAKVLGTATLTATYKRG